MIQRQRMHRHAAAVYPDHDFGGIVLAQIRNLIQNTLLYIVFRLLVGLQIFSQIFGRDQHARMFSGAIIMNLARRFASLFQRLCCLLV